MTTGAHGNRPTKNQRREDARAQAKASRESQALELVAAIDAGQVLADARGAQRVVHAVAGQQQHVADLQGALVEVDPHRVFQAQPDIIDRTYGRCTAFERFKPWFYGIKPEIRNHLVAFFGGQRASRPYGRFDLELTHASTKFPSSSNSR